MTCMTNDGMTYNFSSVNELYDKACRQYSETCWQSIRHSTQKKNIEEQM